MAEQLTKSVGSAGQDGIPQLDTQQYMSTMQQVMQNPQFMSMAERLGSSLMQVCTFKHQIILNTIFSQHDISQFCKSNFIV